MLPNSCETWAIVDHSTSWVCETGVGCGCIVQLCFRAAAAYCTPRVESCPLSGSNTLLLSARLILSLSLHNVCGHYKSHTQILIHISRVNVVVVYWLKIRFRVTWNDIAWCCLPSDRSVEEGERWGQRAAFESREAIPCYWNGSRGCSSGNDQQWKERFVNLLLVFSWLLSF